MQVNVKEEDLKDKKDLENIVDEGVRAIVKAAVEEGGMKALTGDVYMNKEKGVLIRKVRCFASAVKSPLHIRKQRDISEKDYKRTFHVASDGNYCMAIYEGIIKGKTKRTYEIVNMLEAAAYYKKSANLKEFYPIAPETKNGLKYRCMVRTGTQIILLQDDKEHIDVKDTASLSKRLYYVAIMQKDGRIILRHHQEAREATLLRRETKAGGYKETDGYRSQISLSLSDFHALVEGYDFKLNALGKVELIKDTVGFSE